VASGGVLSAAPKVTPRVTPRVTVVTPVYNRAAYVAASLDSILAQSFADFELLVVDDGSTDNSRAIIEARDDPRIRLVVNERNRGIAATRNRAVGLARGAYLAFLDSDDIACPDRLARQVDFLDRHPDIAAVGGWVAWMDESGRRRGKIKRLATEPDDIAAQRLFRPGMVNSAAMARSDILAQFPHREELRVGSDFQMWARFAGRHKMANLPEVLVMVRRHGQRITAALEDQVAAVRTSIYAAQLEALAIAFTETDLERHFMLRRMHKVGFTPDRDYLDWAETWLLGLQAANAAAGLYPEPAFCHELGVFWAKACRHGSAPGRFLTSPLSHAAWPGLWKLVRRYTPIPLPRRSAAPAA
jgi:glycosyltransferase involved in cell wall biosynthesis